MLFKCYNFKRWHFYGSYIITWYRKNTEHTQVRARTMTYLFLYHNTILQSMQFFFGLKLQIWLWFEKLHVHTLYKHSLIITKSGVCKVILFPILVVARGVCFFNRNKFWRKVIAQIMNEFFRRENFNKIMKWTCVWNNVSRSF